MRMGGSDFGCWANVSSLPLSRKSRGHDGKIEQVGKWFAKQRSSDLQKPGWDLVQACGHRTATSNINHQQLITVTSNASMQCEHR